MDCSLFLATILVYTFLQGTYSNDQVFLEHVFPVPRLWDNEPPVVYITTRSLIPIDVNVTVVGIEFETTTNVTRYQYASIALPKIVRLATTGKQNKTVRVTSSGLISVHCIDGEVGAGDVFLALPTAQLGKEYYVVTYKPYDRSYPAFFCVSALDRETNIFVRKKTGYFFQVTLNPYESYRYDGDTDEDLTGTFLRSTQPVSLLSGVRTQVPSHTSGEDGLLEQIIPTKSWGHRFILGPFLERSSGYIYRVITGNYTSRLHISNNGTVEIDANDWFEGDVSSDSVVSIVTDNPVLVIQYMRSKAIEGKFDPAMIIVPPVALFVNDVTFPVVKTTLKSNTYNIHVTINCKFSDTLAFDDVTSALTSENLQSPDGEMCVIRRSVTPGVHSVSHQDPAAKFTVAVYGLSSQSAYAYPASFHHNSQFTMASTTPIPTIHGLNLNCDGPTMTATFDQSVISYTNYIDVHLKDTSCIASPLHGDRAVITTSYPECQTSMEETGDYIIYRNALILSDDPNSPIEPAQVELECRVQRRHLAETSFHSNVRRHVSFGNFTFNLDIFPDQNYRDSYDAEDYPINARLGDPLYLAASVDDTNDLDLFVDSCWGTPSANPRHNSTFHLISDGCPADDSVAYTDTDYTNVQRFNINAFAFKGFDWLVYIHCQLFVCDIKSKNFRCSRGCLQTPARKRRANAELFHVVSSGPLIVRKFK